MHRERSKTALSSSSPDGLDEMCLVKNIGDKKRRRKIERESEKVLNFSYLDCYAVASLELSLGELSWGKCRIGLLWAINGKYREVRIVCAPPRQILDERGVKVLSQCDLPPKTTENLNVKED